MQAQGFPPECMSMCIFRLPAGVQKKLRCLLTTGFSPMWTGPPSVPFYFVPQEISQPSRIGFCEPEHVSFQFGSTGGWVAAQVAAVGLLSTMLNHVHFEIFCHLEGEITLRTWVRSVFSLYFNVHGWFSGQALQWCCLISTVEGWLKIAEAVSRVWDSFKKWK